MLTEKSKKKLAVSQCLVGDNVRYDGRTKAHEFVTKHLSRVFDLRPICPEVEIGLTVPRKPMHLVLKDNTVHALQIEDSTIDYTRLLIGHAGEISDQITAVSAYVFKARSPSCGVNTTDIFNLDKKTSGVFADVICKQHPFLPIIDEVVLDDGNFRDQFLENVFCYAAFQSDKGNFLREYALRWILRTGQNISVLENASPGKLKELFFIPMNQFLGVSQRTNKLNDAVKNNPQIFSFIENELKELINEYTNNQTSTIKLTTQLGDLLFNYDQADYKLSLCSDELDLRSQ